MQTTPSFPTIETTRLVLREIVPDDAPALFDIHGDESLMRWFGVEPLADLAGAEKLVALFAPWRTQPNPGIRWGIQRKGEEGLSGTCGLFGWNRAWRKCTIGYELAFQREGLLRELGYWRGTYHDMLQFSLLRKDRAAGFAGAPHADP